MAFGCWFGGFDLCFVWIGCSLCVMRLERLPFMLDGLAVNSCGGLPRLPFLGVVCLFLLFLFGLDLLSIYVWFGLLFGFAIWFLGFDFGCFGVILDLWMLCCGRLNLWFVDAWICGLGLFWR